MSKFTGYRPLAHELLNIEHENITSNRSDASEWHIHRHTDKEAAEKTLLFCIPVLRPVNQSKSGGCLFTIRIFSHLHGKEKIEKKSYILKYQSHSLIVLLYCRKIVNTKDVFLKQFNVTGTQKKSLKKDTTTIKKGKGVNSRPMKTEMQSETQLRSITHVWSQNSEICYQTKDIFSNFKSRTGRKK